MSDYFAIVGLGKELGFLRHAASAQGILDVARRLSQSWGAKVQVGCTIGGKPVFLCDTGMRATQVQQLLDLRCVTVNDAAAILIAMAECCLRAKQGVNSAFRIEDLKVLHLRGFDLSQELGMVADQQAFIATARVIVEVYDGKVTLSIFGSNVMAQAESPAGRAEMLRSIKALSESVPIRTVIAALDRIENFPENPVAVRIDNIGLHVTTASEEEKYITSWSA